MRTQFSTPKRLVPRKGSQSFGSCSQKGLRATALGSAPALPALLTRISTLPKAARAFSNIALTDAKLVTSHCAAIALTPSFSTSAATASARSRRKSFTTTPPALFSAKRSATARPTPCPAPVTRPTRPLRSRMLLLKFYPPVISVSGEYSRLAQARDFRLRHSEYGRQHFPRMLTDSRPAPSPRKRRAIERESRALDFRFAENRIIDFVKMSRFDKIGVAGQVAASAHDMRRHTRCLQSMLRASAACARVQFAIAASSSARLRSRPTSVSNFAS